MPSCAATWASSSPPMTSPNAYRCGSAVRIRASTVHEALLDLGARRLQADAVGDRRAAGRDEHLLGAQLLGLLPVLARP